MNDFEQHEFKQDMEQMIKMNSEIQIITKHTTSKEISL